MPWGKSPGENQRDDIMDGHDTFPRPEEEWNARLVEAMKDVDAFRPCPEWQSHGRSQKRALDPAKALTGGGLYSLQEFPICLWGGKDYEFQVCTRLRGQG